MKLKALGANQTLLDLDGGRQVFFSYNTPVAAFIPGEGYLRTSQKWSRTTSKHINAWIDGRSSERPQSFFDALIQ